MLNYNSDSVQNLIKSRKWNQLNESDKIKMIYNFVQNEILFGYNDKDTLTAEQILTDKFGQSNTKSTLLMTLLRGVGIPCRLHGFIVSTEFETNAVPKAFNAFVPNEILHSWVEVLYGDKWLALDGVIIDKYYLRALKSRFQKTHGTFKQFAIATGNFDELTVEWNGNDIFVQKEAIIKDLGIFTSPDSFFKKYKKYHNKSKNFMFVYLIRDIMNKNIQKIRNSVLYKKTTMTLK